MTWLAWAAVFWLPAALVVGLIIGRGIRIADEALARRPKTR